MGKKQKPVKTPEELEAIRQAGLREYNTQVTNVILKSMSYAERQTLVNNFIRDHKL